MGRRRFNNEETRSPALDTVNQQDVLKAALHARDLFKYTRSKGYTESSKPTFSKDSCKICQTPESMTEVHKSSTTHMLNFKLYEWANFRKKLIQNRNGVELGVHPENHSKKDLLIASENKRLGSHKIQATVAQARARQNKFSFLIKITNVQNKGIFLIGAELLHPLEFFEIEDSLKKLHSNNVLELEPGASYYFKVVFKLHLTLLGDNKMQMGIQFETLDKQQFTIARQLVVTIRDSVEMEEMKYQNRPPQFVMEETENNLIPPTNYNCRSIFNIPKSDREILRSGLIFSKSFTEEQRIRLREIEMEMKPNYPTKENYGRYFQYCLWMDEIESEVMLRRYNMEGVTMKCINRKCLELEVAGLAEKRPSLVNGDLINIRIQNEVYIYQGVIDRVLDKSVYIKSVNQQLFNTISLNPGVLLDVSFKLKRLPYERMHEGVFACFRDKDLLNCLFPEVSTIQWPDFTNLELGDHMLFNKNIAHNPEQKVTVRNILNCTSGNAPYIVFGPPGTGKTVTIVEAMMQIKSRRLDSKILVCAPANAACDMLTSKLIQCGCTKKELIRIHAGTRDWALVPEDIKSHSNNIEGEYVTLDRAALNGYRIIVTTLILSGKLSYKYHPNYLFIDEAAQAMESEAAVAVALLRSSKHIVLAGDPKQLGPICLSKSATKFQLDVSMLERLMDNPIYMNDNPNFITMLKLNFRSHPQVLKVPNELFYNNSLQAVSRSVLSDPIAVIPIYPRILPGGFQNYNFSNNAATEFCAIISKEKRTGISPSFYNPQEIEMVEKYVIALLNLQEVQVKFEDIGVITPYLRQAQLIKQRLSKRGYGDIEVGSTEVFQGREKRIIIVSTVRAQNSLLLHDQKYKLGFVSNEKRFNVALTRAMSKLIVIGCPNVLRYDVNWLTYIEFCRNNNTYFGAKMDYRTEFVKLEIVKRLNNLHYKYTKNCC